MAKYNLGLNSRPRKERKAYVKKPYEQRGLWEREGRAVRGFWSNNTMDNVMQMTPEELDQVIDNYLEMFIKNQLKYNKRWNFPEAIAYKAVK